MVWPTPDKIAGALERGFGCRGVGVVDGRDGGLPRRPRVWHALPREHSWRSYFTWKHFPSTTISA